VLRICGMAPSSYYYKPAAHQKVRRKVGRPVPGYSLNAEGKRVSDAKIKGYIRRLLGSEEAVYGYRKITRVLKTRFRLKINKK
jgi:putative transposase